MQRCLQLGALGGGSVAPNPMVGAVLVHQDRIIGEGYHRQYGEPHAEVNCINNVAEEDYPLISQSTLYVSLEPCSHFGKTPPCADLIIEKKIPRVVIACRDNYKEVNGQGINRLTDAGIIVVEGVLEKEARELNKRFFTFHQLQRPYVILKWAQSNDHFIAGPEYSSVKISNEYTNRLVHKWRSVEASILVGTNTALYDDPALNTRLWTGKDPVRLVIDTELKLPSSLQLFDKQVKTFVFNYIKREAHARLTFIQLNRDEDMLEQIMNFLYKERMISVLIEGGAGLLGSFFTAALWDEARVITNKDLTIGNGKEAPQLKNAVLYHKSHYLNDEVSYYLHGVN